MDMLVSVAVAVMAPVPMASLVTGGSLTRDGGDVCTQTIIYTGARGGALLLRDS